MVLFSLTISNKWFMSKKCVQRLKYTHRYSSTSSSSSHSSWACVPRPSRWTACHILCWATISSGAVERMRWKPFCATWNCFPDTQWIQNISHLKKWPGQLQVPTGSTSSLDTCGPSQNRSARLEMIQNMWNIVYWMPIPSHCSCKNRVCELTKPLHSNLYEFVPCRIMCICFFGGLEPWSTNCCLSRFGFVTVLLALLSQGVWKKYEETIFFSPWNFYHWARNYVGFTR